MVSLWRRKRIDFTVSGTYDPVTNQVVIVKRHTGQYTNSVEYTGKLRVVEESVGPGEARRQYRCVIEGTYSRGTIHLETILVSNVERTSPSSSDGTVSVSNAASISRTAPSAALMSQSDTTAARSRAREAAEVEDVLNGVWEGESVDTQENRTLWTDTAITFRLHPSTQLGKISGRGVSMWRNMHIDFTISGYFNWSTKEIQIVKQHQGTYTNKIEYKGYLRKRARGENDVSWRIEGQYARGIIALMRVRGFAAASSTVVAASEQKVEDVEEKDTDCEQDRDGEGKNSFEGKESGFFADSQPVSDNLMKYELYLSGMLGAGRTLGPRDQELLAQFRRSHDITDDEHTLVLSNIGLSKSDFSSMCDNAAVDDDGDTCKICFHAKISNILLPCGHYVLCGDCAKNLLAHASATTGQSALCPVCRTVVTKVQPVYRA